MSTAIEERTLRSEDVEFFSRELGSFLPERVFDAHAHLWGQQFAALSVPGGPPDVGYSQYIQLMQILHPRRSIAAMFIPAINRDKRGSLSIANEWVAQHAGRGSSCRGLFLVKPEDNQEWVRQEVRRLKLSGIKCYHTMRTGQPAWNAGIPDYLPEKLVSVANKEGWVVMLHIVRSRAVADPSNIHWIRHYCEQYPNIKLILAHSARGFQPSHNLEGLLHLRGLQNLYFDTSANCEQMAHQTIIRYMGHKKLLYGTDFPISHKRGRSVAVADSFLWLYEDTPVWNEKHAQISPVMIGLEHLRSLKWACWSERLSDSKVEDIFWNNAAKLLDII